MSLEQARKEIRERAEFFAWAAAEEQHYRLRKLERQRELAIFWSGIVGFLVLLIVIAQVSG